MSGILKPAAFEMVPPEYCKPVAVTASEVEAMLRLPLTWLVRLTRFAVICWPERDRYERPARETSPELVPEEEPEKLEAERVPLDVMLPPMEAVLLNSNGAEKLAPPVNVQRPEMVWAILREAGPLA